MIDKCALKCIINKVLRIYFFATWLAMTNHVATDKFPVPYLFISCISDGCFAESSARGWNIFFDLQLAIANWRSAENAFGLMRYMTAVRYGVCGMV